MSRYSRGSDDGYEDRRFHKKRRLLHDVSTVDDSLCQFKKANANWNEVLDDSDRRVFDNEMRRYSSAGAEISRSSKNFRQNRYSDSTLVTPGSSFFCNSEGDSESIASSFKARPKHHKRDIVLSDEFKSALSRDVTLAQDPSFGAALESNKSCFITDNSGSCTSDTTLDIHNHKGLRMKYRRHNAKKDSAKNGEDFENILNNVTTCDYQSRMDPSTAEDNANEVTHLDLNEVSHFKPNETRYGAPSAITYCHSSQTVTQTGLVGGMSYVTISEVKERVIIPGRSCPRPVKKERTEGTADWMTGVNYDEDNDLDHGNSSMKTTNSIAEMGIHREGIKELYDPENQCEILSDFDAERDDLNCSRPRPSHYSSLMRSRERKQRNKKYVISKDVYEEVYKDDSIFNSDINIASSFNITEIDDSNTNNSLRSHKALRYQKNARHSRSRNQSYGSSLNDLSLRSHSRRSILNEISQNEFELRSMEDDTESNGDSGGVLRKKNASRNSEKVFISKVDAVKKVHDHVNNKKIKRDMSTEVRKMARNFKESLSESNIESDENAMNELDSVPMIMENRSRWRNKNKRRVENEFDTAKSNCSMSDSVNSVSFAPEETSVTKKGRLPVAWQTGSKTLEKCRKGRDIVYLKENVHNSIKCSSSGSRDTSMEAYQSDEEVRNEESSLLDVEKPKRRSNRRKRKGSKEFNLTIENASLSSTADSLSMQNSASFMHKKNAITSNSNNDDEIQLIEGFPLEQTQKDIPSLGKLKRNCSKSMSIIDSNIDKEDTFNLNQRQPRRRRNQVKATKTDEFNAHLEDVSSNMEESISAVAEASCQSNVAHKSSVSAIEIQAATVDHQKTSKQVARDSTLATEKKISNESENNFEKRRLLSDNFKPEANPPIIDTARPKRRRNQVKTTNADEFNAFLEDVSSNMEESISSVADSSKLSRLAHKSSISADGIPGVALDVQKKTKQSARDSSLTEEKEMSNETENSINKSRSLSHDPCPEANSPVVDIASPKKSKQSLSVKDDVFNVHLEDASSKTEESIPLIAAASQQSKVVHKSSASVSESPDATDKQVNSSKQKTEEDTSTMNKQVNDEAKININRSSIIADPNLGDATISPKRNAAAQVTDIKMKLLQDTRMSSKNGQPVSLVPEYIAESKGVEESSVPAVIMPKSTVSSEKSNNKNNLEEEPVSTDKIAAIAVESQDTSEHESASDANIIDQQVNDETKRNISKSRVAFDEESGLDVKSPVLNFKSLRRKKQRTSVKGDDFNIAIEDVSLSNAADSITSIAEATHNESLASGKIVEATVENVNRKESVGAPAVDQQLQDNTKRNISKSRLMSEEELSTISTTMDVGPRSRRRKQVKSVLGDAFAIAMEDVSLSIASDSIASVAETSHHSDSAQNECAPAEELPEATVEQSLASGRAVKVSIETVNRKSSVDDAPAIDQQLQDNTKRNISKSGLLSEEELSTVSSAMDVGPRSRRRKQVKAVQGDAFAIAMEDVSLSIASDSIASVAETSHHSASAQNECAPAEELPEATVEQSLPSGEAVKVTIETVNRKSSVDDASAIDQQLQDNTKRNISNSRLMSEEELITVSSAMDVGRKSRRRKQVKSVQGDAFTIAMEDVSLSIASDSIASVAETSHHSDSAQNECAPAEKLPEDTVEQSLVSGRAVKVSIATVNRKSSVDDAPTIEQQLQDNSKRNISKSRLLSEEELSTVSTAMDVGRKSRRRKQVKSVQGDAFTIAMEDVSLSIASDSIASVAETSHHFDLAQNKCAPAEELPEATVEPENSLRKKAECAVSDINQEVNHDLKGKTSNISVISMDELSLDADVTVLDDRRQRRKRIQTKTEQVNQFKILVEDISLSNSISSIAETSQNEKSVKGNVQEGPVELKDISKQKAGVADPTIGQEMNDDAKFNLSKSRLVLDGESSLDAESIVMDIRRKSKRRNQQKTEQNDEFKTAVEDVSLLDVSDSTPSEAEASNQLKVAQKSTKLGHPQLVSGFTGHAETNTSRIQILVDGKFSEEKPVQSEIVTENKPDLPQITCSLDNSLSVSKISNVFVNDVAESTRGFINKGLIYEYFGNVSGITNDTLTDKEDCIYQAEFPHNKSKKSLDLINNKNETLELPHEALRGKSGGENFALETFLIHSLEKHSLHSPDRVKSNVQINVSARNISDLETCGVDLDMPVSLIAEGAISSTGLSEKDELDIIEPPTEAPSKSELSMSLKSNVQNLEDNTEASGNSDPEKLNEDISNFKVAVENIEEEQHNESANENDRGNGDCKHVVLKQNENLPTNVTTAPGGVVELGEPFIEYVDMDKLNPSSEVASISVEAAAQASSSKSKTAQIKAAAEGGTVVLIEKVVETSSNLVNDHIAVAEEVPSNQTSEKLEDNKIIATNAVDSPIENLTDLISEPPVSIAPEEISTVQPDANEPISCTSSTADTAEQLHQTLAHNMLSSKSTKILTEGGISKDLSNQNSRLQIKLFVEQNSEVVKQLSNAESIKGETIIKSCQPNPTIAPKLMSKLPVPIKCNKKSITSKSSCLLKNPSSPPKLIFHDLPEKEKHLKKLDTLKSINEETFTILPLSNSSEKADNLIDEVLKNPGESLLSQSEAPEVHDNVHTVSKALDCENLNADEQTKDLVISNEKSEKLSLSKSFAFLETQAKTSTTINELTFIKTAAPGMTSTPLPSIPYLLKIRCTEDDSMLSGISELALDQIVAQEHLSDAEQYLDPVPKGSLSVSESSPAIHESSPIKSNCHLSNVGEGGSLILHDKTQNQDVSLNKKSIPVTNGAKESTDLNAVKILINSPVPDDLKSSPQGSIPCSLELGVEQNKEKGIHSVKELTFTISVAPPAFSPSKASVPENVEEGKSACASEPVNECEESGNNVLPAIENECTKKISCEVPSESNEIDSAGNEIGGIAPEVHSNVSKVGAQNSATIANSSVNSVNKMLQVSANPCNHSKDDGVNTDSQKPVPPIVACATPPDPTYTIPEPTSPELNGTSNKLGETFSELLLLSPLSTSKWNDICHISDSVPSVLSLEAGDSGKITSTGNESGISSNTRCTGKSLIESEVGHNRNSGTAIEKTIDSSRLHHLKEVDVSHKAPRPISFELNHPRPSCSSVPEKKFRNTGIGEQEINVSGPFCSRKAEGSHLRLSEAVRSEFIQSRPSSSLLSERSSLRPSISNHPRWSSVTSSSAKESDADLTRPGLSSHTSEESSEPELISPEPETLSTPLRTRYRYFSTPTTADRKAICKVIDRIDASAVKRKKQRELIFDTIFPKVIPASNEFKKPKIPPKPKKVQVEDFDEDDEQDIKPPEKKRRLPVWARHELKTVVSEAIEEQEDNLLDPQDFLFDLVDTVKLVMKSKRVKEVRQGVQKVKQELFNLKLVRTLRDFHQFVRDYLPYEFRTRSIPSSGHFKFNPLWETEADLDQPLFHFSE